MFEGVFTYNVSVKVTPLGVEPRTHRLRVCCSTD